MIEIFQFQTPKKASVAARFDYFIAWSKPQGLAGINHIHTEEYAINSQYFEWSKEYFSNRDRTTRSWFLRFEYLSRGREVFSRARKGKEPNIFIQDGLFQHGRFLEFSKSYLNISMYLRRQRTPNKPLVIALICIERALRIIKGHNDPVGLNAKVFESAVNLLQNTNLAEGLKYDIANEMEILSGLIQSGYSSKNNRFEGRGFNLLDHAFVFTSSIRSIPRRRAIDLNTTDLKKQPARIGIEEVAAVGLAYRKSASIYGSSDIRTFVAAIAGLALTTVSMRASDMFTLQRDAIYTSADDAERRRIRIGRPKIEVSQDLPIAKKLGKLAEELFTCILRFTDESHKAFSFYYKQAGEDFKSISDIYIPDRLKLIFSNEFLTIPQVYEALEKNKIINSTKLPPQKLYSLPTFYFVENPCDIWQHTNGVYLESGKFIKISELVKLCKKNKLEIEISDDVDRNLYINFTTARNHIKGLSSYPKMQILQPFFHKGKVAEKRLRTIDLKAFLLEDFKKHCYCPHWPYTSKERITRLDQALLVATHGQSNKIAKKSSDFGPWWLPSPIVSTRLSPWLSRFAGKPARLFYELDITLSDGTYPSLTLHETRKYHHTQALLAGAHEVFIDELAGRQNGRQSDHYDKRSPLEIIRSSIETYDPDNEPSVIGPVAVELKRIKITDRAAFLYTNAAPKHITDVGGCATDWSLDPCKQYGDCMRCNQHLWRKGDKNRLANIKERRVYAINMIAVANEKISFYDEPPRSLIQQLRQFKDDLSRCDAILAAEQDSSISVGTMITFSQPENTMTASDLTEMLAAQNSAQL